MPLSIATNSPHNAQIADRPVMRRGMSFAASRAFGTVYAAMAFAVLGGFVGSMTARKMLVIWTNDSFGYFESALILASGEDLTSHLDRGIGYPGLLAAMLHAATLRALPRYQLAMLLAGVLLLVAVLYCFVRFVLDRSFPRPNHAAGLAARAIGSLLGGLYAFLVFVHDGFVLKFYTVWAETTHVFLTALALVLFVAGQIAKRPRTQMLFLAAAAGAAYLSTTVKPHTLFVFALTLVALAVRLVLNLRTARSPAITMAIAAVALIAGSTTYFEHRVASVSAREFGPKTLFCNHLPLVLPTLGTATPERAELSALFSGILAEGSEGWSILGHNGDRCMYNSSVDPLASQIAQSEGLTRADWYGRQFVRGVERRPFLYAGRVLRQLAAFFEDPTPEITLSEAGSMGDWDWVRLENYRRFLGEPREAFTVREDNWFAVDAGGLGRMGKNLLATVSYWFAATVLPATLLAAGFLVAGRGGRERRAEIVLLSVAAFVGAYLLLIASSHTFDIARYRSALVPFTLLWLLMSAAYLAGLIGHGLAIMARAGFRSRECNG